MVWIERSLPLKQSASECFILLCLITEVKDSTVVVQVFIYHTVLVNIQLDFQLVILFFAFFFFGLIFSMLLFIVLRLTPCLLHLFQCIIAQMSFLKKQSNAVPNTNTVTDRMLHCLYDSSLVSKCNRRAVVSSGAGILHFGVLFTCYTHFSASLKTTQLI